MNIPNIDLTRMSETALQSWQQTLKGELRRCEAMLAGKAPHGLRVTVETTTADIESIRGIVGIAEHAIAVSSGRQLEIRIHEQDSRGASLWSSISIAELSEKYKL